jgi:hypothetical protein
MAVVFYSRLDSLTLDATHELTNVAMSFTAAGTTSFASAAGFAGNGLLCEAANSYLDSGNVETLISPSAGSCGLMIRFPSTVPTFGDRVTVVNVNATEAIRLNISSNSFQLQWTANSATVSVLANVTLSSNTWYGVVVRWNQPNNRLELEMYDANGDALGSWSHGAAFNAWTTATRSFRVGANTSAANTGHYDNFFISDDPDEPIQNNFSINSITSYSSGAAVDLYPDVEPLYYGGNLLANKSNIEYRVSAGHTGIDGLTLVSGVNATTDGSGVLQLPLPVNDGEATDPVTLALYFEEGSDPVVDRSLIVKTTLVEA